MQFKQKLQEMREREWDHERVGRALIEYGGIPLAIFMGAGVLVNVAQGWGMYHEFLDPAKNFPLYYILNFWLVGAVYWYRQNYHPPILFENRTELILAGVAGILWIAVQPFFLLIGYATYFTAVLRDDELHGSLLPDFTDIEAEADKPTHSEKDEAWGHIQNADEMQ